MLRLLPFLLVCCSFAESIKDLQPHNVKMEETEFQGRKCVHLTAEPGGDWLALVKGSDFSDGIIEADVALHITTPPGVRMPGFIGVAFRTRADASHYELFYIRPGNSHSADQGMRSHSAQYTSEPNFSWYALRRQWPFIYEADADIAVEAWTKLRIEVTGRLAKLYLNGSPRPTLVVDGMKGEDLRGAVALWVNPGEEAYFSNLRITPSATPTALENNGEAVGTWDVKFGSDAGAFSGTMKLTRAGTQVHGSWSGAFGDDLPVAGVWRNGYIDLTFSGDWSKDNGLGNPGTVALRLEGWVDGDSATGRMKAQDHADGRWSATRKK